MLRTARSDVLIGVFASVAACATTPGAQKTDPTAVRRSEVELVAPDGVRLKASYLAAAGEGPGILLFHMCGGATRRSWDDVASRLAARGFHVLTLDYRGFGESGGERFETSSPADRRAAQAKWPGDLDVAFEYLAGRPDVDRAWIGAGGASCGVDNAVELARRHSEVRALVLLSGGVGRAGVDHIRASPSLALFAAASDDDGDFVPYVRWLSAFSRNPANRIVTYQKAGHGTDMLAVEPELAPAIVAFFERTLRAGGSDAPPPAEPEAAPLDPQVSFWITLTGPDGAAKALELVQEARRRDPPLVLAPEMAIAMLAVDSLRGGDPQQAIRILAVGLEQHPRSVRLHATRSAAYVDAGDRDRAIEAAGRALELLDADPTMSADDKAAFRRAIEQRLEALER